MELAVVIIAAIIVKFIIFILIVRPLIHSMMTYLDYYQARKKVLGQNHKRHVRIAKWISNKYWQNIYKNRERN